MGTNKKLVGLLMHVLYYKLSEAMFRWVAANVRMMHKSSKTGKLSGTPQIADYLSYPEKVVELLESYTLALVPL